MNLRLSDTSADINKEGGKRQFSLTDMAELESLTAESLGERLRSVGIPLTLQRLAIAQVLLVRPVHMTAEQILAKVQDVMAEISRATVYNTVKLFKDKGLIRELTIDSGQTVYDSNTSPHYHIYNVETGEMTDIPAGDLKVVGETALPAGVKLEEVDVIIRVQNK